MKSRNCSVDCLKLCLAIFICLWHFGLWKPLNGTMIVSFFFVISGYYLFRKFDVGSTKGISAYKYSYNRLKIIAPYYLISLILFFFILNIQILFDNSLGFISELLQLISEAFCLQSSGVFASGINYPLWQLSALLISSFFMFSLLKWNRDLVEGAIAPLSALLVFTYIVNVKMNEDILFSTVHNLFYLPLIRSWGGISLGVALYKLFNHLAAIIRKMHYYIRILLILLSIGLLFLWRNDMLSLFPFCFIFSFCLSNNLSLRKRIPLDKISLSLYCNHAIVIYVIKHYFTPFYSDSPIPLTIVIYLIVTIVYSILFVLIIDKLKPVIARVYRKLIFKTL